MADKPLPPLTSLRAFEAAARLLSFTRAARELHVTPAAISHQIRGLERHLGVELFRRGSRRLTLTDSGQLAAEHLREGFERLARGVGVLRGGQRSGLLTVGATRRSQRAGWFRDCRGSRGACRVSICACERRPGRSISTRTRSTSPYDSVAGASTAPLRTRCSVNS